MEHKVLCSCTVSGSWLLKDVEEHIVSKSTFYDLLTILCGCLLYILYFRPVQLAVLARLTVPHVMMLVTRLVILTWQIPEIRLEVLVKSISVQQCLNLVMVITHLMTSINWL